ncbi:MAG: tRNA uridine(34) 5-carboxymethylaminomethyl modification radical SAM/GNAT enzyme Elp3 [Nanoarchaeota archaeon]|nr:tRNA uridine(34) 5-carboxymethylaminomethyl modification radical SAM/GNAT enzyme Elp3 [Nanoarchaeota archaeon]MBU1644273.1 tRNA uridine(34) 5-carboxymethylaminomethyl modification radical SAM/GNAT enzyme Elp3 [Nanoarchaeota archaeon]
MDFYEEMITELKKENHPLRELTKLKRDLAIKHKLNVIPSNIDVLLHAKIEDLPRLKKQLLTKPVRTLSGVSPVAIMTAPANCPHGKCTFCPGGVGSPWGDVPQSYSGHEPATMRGMRNNYDPYLQVFNRLEQYILLGHNIDKIEVIVMGGTFTATEKEYQEEFIGGVFKALNDFSDLFFKGEEFDYTKFKLFFELPGDIQDKKRTENIQKKLLELKNRGQTNLEQEQEKNENYKVKCVALCIETKPDWGLLKHGNEMLRQGCTRVELGIQSVYDDVLKHVHRGHTSEESKRSVQILRDLGFKINFHYMPGLPLTDYERDLAGMKRLFTDPGYRPDMIKLYPCMVAEGTALYHEFKRGEFTPMGTEEAAKIIVEWKKIVPEYCRIQRVQRDVPTKYWEAGVDKTNLRQYAQNVSGFKCRCIRCREPKGNKINWEKIEIKVNEYEASGGKEFFISAEDPDQDLIVGFCRLRFPSESLREEITPTSALTRELHVYGTATAIGDEGLVQHRGIGKRLMEKAEKISKQNNKDKMVVISGVGVRTYYEKIGYRKEGPYMVKEI